MHGSLNVVTGFAFGMTYDFHDPDFKLISKFVQSFFDSFLNRITYNGIHSITPIWLLNLKPFRMFCNWLFSDVAKVLQLTYQELHPYFFRMIKDHQNTIDENNARDFLGMIFVNCENIFTIFFRYFNPIC